MNKTCQSLPRFIGGRLITLFVQHPKADLTDSVLNPTMK
jgi:hypothetical protein